MIAFWILAGLLTSAAAVLVLWRAAAATRAPESRPEVTVYERQLAEIDELADRGLLEAEEHRAARAEAARRLLRAADAPPAPVSAGPGLRRVVLAAAVVGPLAGLGVYLLVGSPGLPDQPFRTRLAAWTETSRRNPMALSPPQMAAVLEQLAKDNPTDPTPLFFLAREQAASGQGARVLITLKDAIRRAPERAELWTALGQAEVAQSDGQVNADARAAFAKALQLQPTAVEPRYFLARAQIAAGDVNGGLSVWKALLAGFPPGDPNRQALAEDIARVETSGGLAPATPAPERAAAAAPPQTSRPSSAPWWTGWPHGSRRTPTIPPAGRGWSAPIACWATPRDRRRRRARRAGGSPVVRTPSG